MTTKPRLRATNDGKLVPVTDSLKNLVSGLGTGNDKRTHNEFVFSNNWLNFSQLEAAYTENWIARQIVDVPIEDAMREWRTFKCPEAADIAAEEKRLGLVAKYSEGRKWSKLYGGAGILMVTDQPMDQPLNLEAIKKGGLKRLVTLDRWEIQPQLINFTDPIAENYLLPEFYQVRGGSYRIHHSHIIRIDGESLPRRVRAFNEGWGDSRLRQVLDDLKDIVASRSGIATMIQESNVDVVTRDGLSNELASDEESNVLKRFALGAQMKSLVNMLLLDGEESYERKQLSFSGLEGILDKFMIWISGAADIPMTRLFGRSAAGMNATGDGDLNNYYDGLAGAQETRYRPELEKLDEVLIRSAVGNIPEECEWQWNPLYQESGTELAQQELALAQANDIYYQQGSLQRSHIMLRLKGEGRYAIEDDEIEAMKAQEKLEAEGGFGDDPLVLEGETGADNDPANTP